MTFRTSNLVRASLCLAAVGASACDDSASLYASSRASLDPRCFGDAGAVIDLGAPALTPRTINLWPPNHKFHTIGVEDCVDLVDLCEPDLRAEFTYASSDEPVDDRGDGHHAPDILFDGCQRVQLRAERQGPKEGRVYKLGVRVVDRSGNTTESTCSIVVDHDQRGVLGADSGESYRVLPTDASGAVCDGVPPLLPPVTPPVAPPADAGMGPIQIGI